MSLNRSWIHFTHFCMSFFGDQTVFSSLFFYGDELCLVMRVHLMIRYSWKSLCDVFYLTRYKTKGCHQTLVRTVFFDCFSYQDIAKYCKWLTHMNTESAVDKDKLVAHSNTWYVYGMYMMQSAQLKIHVENLHSSCVITRE